MKRIHLVENCMSSWGEVPSFNKLKLNESIRIIEADGKKYESNSAYEVPVWKLDKENLNKRTYSAKLGEKVVQAFKERSTLSLADHPKSGEDGSVKDIVAVAKNPHIKTVRNEKVLFADCYFVDEAFGKKVEKIVENGAGVGLSSSAYGEVGDDGKIIEETFELERFFDFVLNPSYEVELDQSSVIKEAKGDCGGTPKNDGSGEGVGNKDKKDDEKEDNEVLEKKDTNIIDEKKKQEKPIMKLTLDQKNIIWGLSDRMKKAEDIDDLQRKKEIYEEILEYGQEAPFAQEYFEKAEAKIKEINTTILELAEKGKGADSIKEEKEKFEKDNVEIKEKYEDLVKNLEKITLQYEEATEMLDGFKIREKKLQDLYKVALAEKNTLVKTSEYKEALSYIDELEEKIFTLNEKLETIEEEKEEKKEACASKKKKKEAEDNDEKEDEIEEDDAEDKEVEEKKKKKESVEKKDDEMNEEINEEEIDESYEENFGFSQLRKVKSYYYDLVESNPNVKMIKDEILKCKTVLEAQKTYINLSSLLEDIPTPFSKKLENQENYIKENRKEGNTSSTIDKIMSERGYA